MQPLFDEIHEGQKARNDLLRWKLIIVSTIGAVGLGFRPGPANPNVYLALSIIPLVCVYVDLLCRNLSLRTKQINEFLALESQRDDASIELRYERFSRDFKPRRGPALESLALVWSTALLSIATTSVGFAIAPPQGWIKWLFLASGASGLILTLVVERRYQSRKKELGEYARGHAESAKEHRT